LPNVSRWIDAHCHLADSRLDQYRAALVEQCRTIGITRLIQGGVDPDDWDRQLNVRADFGDLIVPVFGAYPIWAGTAEDAVFSAAMLKLEQLLPHARALGEVGLDFRGPHDSGIRERQSRAFEKQLAIAAGAGFPIILHVVHAHPEALRILRKAKFKEGGILHGYTGHLEQAKEYIDLGLAVSAGCGILRGTGHALRSAMTAIPSDFLVIESDAPDQPPPLHLRKAGAMGDLHGPASILVVASEIAELRSSTPEEVLDRSSANLRRIFRL